MGAEDRRGVTAVGGAGPGWTVRIDVFFKKKIITIYLHPGAREGKGRQGLGWFYLQGTQEGRGLKEVEAWGRGGGQGGRRSSSPQHPVLLFPPHNQLKSS